MRFTKNTEEIQHIVKFFVELLPFDKRQKEYMGLLGNKTISESIG